MTNFWITNTSKNLVSLGDLGILLQPHQSVNLLDHRHYSISLEQIQSSISSGSIARTNGKVVVRKVPPPDPTKIYRGPSTLKLNEAGDFPSFTRSILEHTEFDYEALQITDDEYAKENADLAEEDDLGRFKK